MPRPGFWYQVVDQGSKSDNWLESSGSGMFVYALKVAVNRGYIDSSYSAVADSGWKGLQTKVTTDSSGSPTITRCRPRHGRAEQLRGYVGRARARNTAHGLWRHPAGSGRNGSALASESSRKKRHVDVRTPFGLDTVTAGVPRPMPERPS